MESVPLSDIEKIDNSIIHVIPSFACNLDCPHCDQKHKTERYAFNESKFFESFNALQRKNNSIALFGGEPFLNKRELLFKILDSGKITTTTSNLLLLDDQILDKLIEKKIILGTSWNPERMSDAQYESWLDNLEKVSSRGVWMAMFITLTDDLVDSKLYDVFDDLNDLNVASITFNVLMPSTKGLIDKIDKWLCKLEDDWRWKFRNMLREQYLCLDGMKNACRHSSFTLYPDGTMSNECTHSDHESHWNGYEECKDCIFYNICSPCPKQPGCHFFKRYWLKLARYTMLNVYSKKQNACAELVKTPMQDKITDFAKALLKKSN